MKGTFNIPCQGTKLGRGLERIKVLSGPNQTAIASSTERQVETPKTKVTNLYPPKPDRRHSQRSYLVESGERGEWSSFPRPIHVLPQLVDGGRRGVLEEGEKYSLQFHGNNFRRARPSCTKYCTTNKARRQPDSYPGMLFSLWREGGQMDFGQAGGRTRKRWPAISAGSVLCHCAVLVATRPRHLSGQP